MENSDSSDSEKVDIHGFLEKRVFKLGLNDVISSETEFLIAEQCIGKVSAEIKYSCPPGYPILIYGEQILVEHLSFLDKNEMIEVIKDSTNSETSIHLSDDSLW